MMTFIEYICKKIHDTEWSGVLFYKIEGSFEEKDLTVRVIDILLMDIGEPGSTEFDMSPDVIGYMCEHPELLEQGVYQGLIHSHHDMQAYFSSTDLSTAQAEGNDRNHFVSLIVNNKKPYAAAITRKYTAIKEVKEVYEYPTFDDNKISKEVEYKEEVDELEFYELHIYYGEIDTDKKDEVDEIIKGLWKKRQDEKNKKRVAITNYNNYNYNKPISSYGGTTSNFQNQNKVNSYPIQAGRANIITKDQGEDLFNGQKRVNSLPVVANSLEQELPFEEDYIKKFSSLEETVIPYEDITIDSDQLDYMLKQIITGTVLLPRDNKIDLMKFVDQGAVNLYKERFDDLSVFESWVDSIIEFVICWNENLELEQNYTEEEIWSIYAYKLLELFDELPTNEYMEIIAKQIATYII